MRGQVLQAVAGVRGASATSGMWAARAGARQAFGVGAGPGGRKRKGVQGMLRLALSKVRPQATLLARPQNDPR